MDELETLFSSSSELRIYYTRLLGVAASAAQAEDAVAAGRYDEAGKSLLDVMSRLTDVLLDMQEAETTRRKRCGIYQITSQRHAFSF